MGTALLSKSKYMAGLQCPKLLWTHYNDKALIPEADAGTQARFDQGKEVGKLAQSLFPGGVEVPWSTIEESVLATAPLLKDGKAIFEASFSAGGVYVRTDILDPVSRGAWDIVEVKSSASVKEEHIPDLAVQRHCCEKAGLKIRRCRLMHVDSQYIRRGEIKPLDLFADEDVTEQVAANSKGIVNRIAGMHDVIRQAECPAVGIGPQCDSPYECPLKYLCWKDVMQLENSIFTLYRMRSERKWAYYDKGIRTNQMLPPDASLSRAQEIQIRAEQTGKVHVERNEVEAFVAKLEWPLHFLDFETFATAIPMLDGTSPYQQVPFQYSLRVVSRKGASPVHHSWLWDGEGDPREAMLAGLSGVIGEAGSIVAYNAGFEKSRLRESAQAFPKFGKWVSAVTLRTVDLLEPFRSFAVYHPAQHGSASIKDVLPALTGKGYEDLAISDGAAAGREFLRVTFAEATAKERNEVRRQLEEYCGLDTSGMVDILAELRRL